MGRVLELPKIHELGIEHGEETLDGRVVETVALSGHTLDDTMFAQLHRKRSELVLPALVRVENRPLTVGWSCDSLVQHLHEKMELGDVGYPFLV